MMRLSLPLDAGLRSSERRGDLLRAAVFAAAGALLALRIYCALRLAMNSDEPQHLHVVWAWTQGLLPYRDVFDNHAPLSSSYARRCSRGSASAPTSSR